MSKVYKNQVTVRVWRNVKRLGKLPTSHFGHAAIVMSGMFVPCDPDDGRRRVQVSFWPGEGAGIGMSALRKQPGTTTQVALQDKVSEMNKITALRLEVGYRDAHGIKVPKRWRQMLANQGRTPLAQPRSGQERLGEVDDDGMPLWSQSPEKKFVLPGFNNAGLHWGLSITQMNRWWTQFKDSTPTYQALSYQNCAGVALMALRAGGAEAFVDLPAVRIYAEPAQVEGYVAMLATEFERMEAWSAELDTDIRRALASRLLTPDMLAGTSEGLWPVAEWKRQSALGPLQPRSSTIRAIDEALDQYHTIHWQTDHASKYRALARLFRGIVLHRQQKAQSERSAAVLGLGLQVLALLRKPGPHWG